MKRHLAPLLLAAALMLASCGQSFPPGERELQDTFTKAFLEQITRYSVEQRMEQFFLDSVALEQQWVSDGSVVSCCLLTMSNRRWRCEAQVRLTHICRETGAWELTDWDLGEVSITETQGGT